MNRGAAYQADMMESSAIRLTGGCGTSFGLYLPLVDEWMMFDNSGNAGYELIAAQVEADSIQVMDTDMWEAIKEQYDDSAGR